MKRKPIGQQRRALAAKRQSRRTPDARALEWATARLEKAVMQQGILTTRLQALQAEIPRLRGIIAALEPAAPTSVARPAVKGVATFGPHDTAPLLAPKIVAGMDVSRFVTPRAPVVADAVAPDMPDSDDALLDIADRNLGKGMPIGE